jgi:archaeal flagellin FlaB
MKSRKAEMGMGTLILFIAMILVAAVAASVLISTTGTLQNKALSTGKATASEVGTSLNVVQIYAEDGSNQDVEEFTTVLKLNSGSEPIRFEDLLLSMNLMNTSADYTYNDSIDCSNTSNTTAGGTFGIDYSIVGPNNMTGYLTRGDVVKICYEAPRSVGESERVIISLIPKVGSTRVIDMGLPDLMVQKRIDVFP